MQIMRSVDVGRKEMMEEMMGDNQLLKIAEVAKLLRVSGTQAYRLMEMGQLPHVRIGERALRVRVVDLNQYITEHLSSGKTKDSA